MRVNSQLTHRTASSAIGVSALSSTTLGCLLVASGVFAIVLRVAGSVTGIPLLREALPAQVLYLLLNGCLAFLMVQGARTLTRSGLFATLAYIYLLSLLALHLIASPPAGPEAWNTGPTELARAFALHTMMLTAVLVSSNGAVSPKQAVLCFRLIIATGVFMVAMSCLQLAGFAPHFYFQWYGSSHLPRPTGGLEHPHFFAAYLVLAIAASKWLHIAGYMRTTSYRVLFLVLASGIVISTSRVGVLAFAAYLLAQALASSGTMTRLVKRVSAFFAVVALAATTAAAIWMLLPDSAAAHYMEVFASAFISSFSGDVSDGEFLRGRGSRWSHEMDLITADPIAMLFGYGHQPFVSHNLILRQLQVSGITGTVSYLFLLGAFLASIVTRADQKSRPVAVGVTSSMVLASLTFPVFVSVTIISAISLLIVASRALYSRDRIA
ncbi:hypothetical protein [Stenotrophomonas chelatiphaga]|uniref:hypothetical protein n=1 Tax=Stenotrophomonas chelatiphaga TaxID=517011 RepID=UPI000B265C28|nr:hypothetical protein [Stenotrophomonas chelatiphaga]